MDEHRLASAMLDFEREQAILGKRPPLPCDGKVEKYKQPDRTQDLLYLIKDNPGIATNQLFDLVNFGHADFTMALRTLTKRGHVLVGQKGKSRIYFPMVQ